MSRALLKSTSVVSAFTLVSRVLGLVRDIVFAKFFGAGPLMDAFLVAFKIPNYLRRLFGEGAFAQAFVPVVSEYREQRSHEEVKSLADTIAGTFGGLLLTITAFGMLAAPGIVYVFAPGFADNPGQVELTADLLRITFPYLFFIALTAFAGGILNTYGRFAAPALAPVLLNIALISSAIWGSQWFDSPIYGLAWGVFAAGVAQLLLQLPWLARLKLLPRPRWDRAHAGVKQVGRLMLPALFGSSVAQVNLLVDTLVASFLAAGSITWLYYGDRLMEFPLGVFAIALGTVILPKLSQQHAAKDSPQFSQTLDFALRLVMLVALPAAVGLFTLAGPIIATLFFRGEFVASDVNMTRYALMAYALGLMGFTLVKILAPGYFARQDTKTPVKVGIVAVCVNVVLNIAFVLVAIDQEFIAPHAGLALATGFAAITNASLLFIGLRRRDVYHPGAGWGLFALRCLLANATMAAVVTWQAGGLSVESLAPWLEMDFWGRILRLAWCIAAGALAYVIILFLLGLRPRHLKGAPGRAASV
ncbi:MAG: murein biosynthesis integral membrane protein MurJ [Gammaproteobacteria bacterium]|nr:murein biosynthesis integral membrane protein MurJ [Gammaproteobacteria bacterium]